MDRMDIEDLTLFGLLGRSWHLDAAVIDVVFDRGGSAVAFPLVDGSVAIARIKDAEPAAQRIRVSGEDGRSTILPRTKPLPPMTRFAVQERTPVATTAYGKHGFVLGNASGGLFSVTTGGERTPFPTPLDGPITALDHVPETGRLACATGGRQVVLMAQGGLEPERLDHETPIATLRFSPLGDALAVAQRNRITLWNIEHDAIRIVDVPTDGRSFALAWSPDQARLAYAFESDGIGVWRVSDGSHITLADYPSPVRSIAWSADGDSLVTSGAFRLIAWPLVQLKPNGMAPSALETGKPGLVAVEVIATHPKRPLVAAGYENGMVTIAELGKQDELLIKTEGRGAISGLKWSDDGRYLALGSDRGLAAIVELPPQLFR